MLLVKVAHYPLTEREAHAAIIVSIAVDTTLRVRPEQIAEEALVWHIGRSHNILDLVQIFELGAQAAVHAEDFFINQSGNGKAVEDVTENAPESDTVAPFALVVEAVDTVDLGTLVITSKQEKVLRVLDLVAEQKADSLN